MMWTASSFNVTVRYPSEDPNLQPVMPSPANQLADDVGDSYLQYAPKLYQVRCQVAFFTIPLKRAYPRLAVSHCKVSFEGPEFATWHSTSGKPASI
jgi:hypothetical protein